MIEGLPQLYTLKQVAEQTGFALRTLERDVRAGKIAHVRRGRARFMTAAQVQALIEEHTQVATDPDKIAQAAQRAAAQTVLDRMLTREARKLQRRRERYERGEPPGR